MLRRLFPESLFSRRLDDDAERRLRLAQARAEERIIDAHVTNALMFVDTLAEDLSFDRAIDTYVRVMGIAEPDQDRTNAEGKASSVQFVHFRFSRPQIERFRKTGETIVVGMDHENYAHMAVMPDAVRQELAGDFD